MKAITLARESDKNQESNEAQTSRLDAYVTEHGLEPWKAFKIKESSTRGYRKKFQEIIALIEKSKETIALVVDTVDRLQRGFKESVVFDELRKEGKVELHFYRERLIINKRSNSADIIRWDMAVMFAKSYVLQLSDNLTRKYEKMREDGEIMSAPPLGYKSIYNDNPIRRRRIDVIPDEKAHYIVTIYEMYARGDISVKTLADKMYELGFRNSSGKYANHAVIFEILENPFYHGYAHSRKHNLTYKHRYKSLISKQLYDACQAVMARHNKMPTKYASKPFIFKNLITCEKCGGVIGGQLKKGKYAYYSCSGYKGCKRQYVPEAKLLKQITGLLGHCTITDKQIEEITEALRKIEESKSNFYDRNVKNLRTEHSKYEARIRKMYEDKLDGRITDEMYDNFLREYKSKQAELMEQMQDHSDADEHFYLTANMTLRLAKRAKAIFESSEVDEKRQFLGFLLQNCTLNAEKLTFSMRSPFNVMFQNSHHLTVRATRDSTFVGQSPQGYFGASVSTLSRLSGR